MRGEIGRFRGCFAVLLLLGGCVMEPLPSATPDLLTDDAIDLPPPPQRPLAVGIYNCIDTTGQRRPTGSAQELSTAVPLDCTPLLIEQVRRLRPGYLTLVERQHVDELLRERQLATLALSTTAAEQDKAQASAHRLATLRVAELLLLGQVVAYDRATREITAGVAINGIGGDKTLVTYVITFSLRAVAVQTGEILGQTLVTKSVTSLRVQGYDDRIFTTKVLQIELGAAGNEPVGLALRAAVRSALTDLIYQGIQSGWWS
jgi:curli biogenesis system outer membrane secretion channel CsgG